MKITVTLYRHPTTGLIMEPTAEQLVQKRLDNLNLMIYTQIELAELLDQYEGVTRLSLDTYGLESDEAYIRVEIDDNMYICTSGESGFYDDNASLLTCDILAVERFIDSHF